MDYFAINEIFWSSTASWRLDSTSFHTLFLNLFYDKT